MKYKILFVCLGNICRSPLAKAIFNQQLAHAGLSHAFESDACGTGGHHQGEAPDARTIRNARKNGVEIQHRARKLQTADFQNFHLILPMDASNFRDTIAFAEKHGAFSADIRMLRSFDPEAPQPDAEVPDPWYGGEEGFEEVFQILHRSCQALVENLKKNLLQNQTNR